MARIKKAGAGQVTPEDLKRFSDAAHEAKRFTELLPRLPDGLTGRHLRALDTVRELSGGGGPHAGARVVDVSARMGSTGPSVTRLLGQLADRGLVEKTPDEHDRRAVRVRLTAAGAGLLARYADGFFSRLAGELADLDPDDIARTVRTIRRVRAAAAGLRDELEREDDPSGS